MIVLGIDTSTHILTAGLAGDNGLNANQHMSGETIHSEELPGMVQRVLSGSSIAPGNLDGIAVSMGPGSFTGLRIGLGFAKGMALGLDVPLLPVPTMDGLAAGVSMEESMLCILLKARKGEVYQGLYRSGEDGWHREGDIATVPESHLGKALPDERIVFAGPGAVLYQTLLKERLGGRAIFVPELVPSGFRIAEIGLGVLAAGHYPDVNALVPMYIKRFRGVA